MDTDTLEHVLRKVDAGEQLPVIAVAAHRAHEAPPAFAHPLLEERFDRPTLRYIESGKSGRLTTVTSLTNDGTTRHIYEVRWGDVTAFYSQDDFDAHVTLAARNA